MPGHLPFPEEQPQGLSFLTEGGSGLQSRCPFYLSFCFFSHTAPVIPSPARNAMLPPMVIQSLVPPLRFSPVMNTASPAIHRMHPVIVSFFIVFTARLFHGPVSPAVWKYTMPLSLRKPFRQVFFHFLSNCRMLFIEKERVLF